MDNLYHHAYKSALQMPQIALIDQYVQIRKAGTRLWRKILDLEMIPPHQIINLGAIAANTALAKQNAVNMALYDDEFAQWRWYPIDPFQVSVYNPAGIAKWQLRNRQVGITPDIITRDPLLVSTEIFTWEDEWPSFEALNYSDYAIAASRIIAFGFRYITAEVDATTTARLVDGLQPYTIVPCSALGPGPR